MVVVVRLCDEEGNAEGVVVVRFVTKTIADRLPCMLHLSIGGAQIEVGLMPFIMTFHYVPIYLKEDAKTKD